MFVLIRQFVLSVGIAILLASTYTTLSEQEKLAEESVIKVARPIEHQDHRDIAELAEQNNIEGLGMNIKHRDHEHVAKPIEQEEQEKVDGVKPGRKGDQDIVVKPVEHEDHKNVAEPVQDKDLGDVAKSTTEVFVVNGSLNLKVLKWFSIVTMKINLFASCP